MPGRPTPASRRSQRRPIRRRSFAVGVVAAAIVVTVLAPATATARPWDSLPEYLPEGVTDLGDITGVVTRIFRDEALDSVNNPSDYFRFELTARRAVRLVVRKLTLEADLFVEDSDHVVVASSENPGTAKDVAGADPGPGGVLHAGSGRPARVRVPTGCATKRRIRPMTLPRSP